LELQEKLAGTLETPVSLYSFTQVTPADAELAHGCLAYVLLRFDPTTKKATELAKNKKAKVYGLYVNLRDLENAGGVFEPDTCTSYDHAAPTHLDFPIHPPEVASGLVQLLQSAAQCGQWFAFGGTTPQSYQTLVRTSLAEVGELQVLQDQPPTARWAMLDAQRRSIAGRTSLAIQCAALVEANTP
jgi:hypothetical protein